MKVIIAGSRSFGAETDLMQLNLSMAALAWPVTEVVSGGARGADLAGEQWARDQGIAIRKFVPDWRGHGRRAGIVRNIEMANYADAAVVFWDGSSRGSANMIEEMRKRGKPVEVVYIRVRPAETEEHE